MVEGFEVIHISDTTVKLTWQRIESDAVDRYAVYYYSSSEVKGQVDSGSKNFSANVIDYNNYNQLVEVYSMILDCCLLIFHTNNLPLKVVNVCRFTNLITTKWLWQQHV